MSKLATYVVLAISICSAALAQFILKQAAGEISTFNIKELMNLKLWGGMLLFGISFILWTIVLKYTELSRTYPVFVASTIILVSLLSIFFLNEKLSWVNVGGLVLILAGIFLLQLK